MAHNMMTDAQMLDRIRVEDVMLRERAARDGERWDEMADCYHPNSEVDISWYKGGGDGFVKASRAMAERGSPSFHVIGQSIVQTNGNRALLDTDCTIHVFVELDGCEADVVSLGRLQWRMLREHGDWLIAGLRGYYIRDMLVPLNPGRVPQIDQSSLKHFRSSYRYLSYVLKEAGRPAQDHLPGVDRPDLVEALRAGERSWLIEG